METATGGVKLAPDRPTMARISDLGEWVIWQFPQRQRKGYCGAVRQALPDAPWVPAIIQSEKGRIQIYGHLDATYDSPETAVSYFTENK